jgi:hypothetical protein
VIVKALYERPGLQLEISGSVDTNTDLSGLRAVLLEKQLRVQKWQALRKADREAVTPDQITLTAEERPALVKNLYDDYLAKGLIVTSSNSPAIPVTQSPVFKKTTERGATQLINRKATPTQATPATDANSSTNTATDPFEAALLNGVSVAPDDFQLLAAQRAKAVREYILQSGKVEGERVFLTENKTAGLKTDGSRVYLQLQ